jgi:hypothetical protein
MGRGFRIRRFFSTLAPVVPDYEGPDWCAATDGAPSGDGSIGDPWDLATALVSTKIKPGHTLYLRGGVYASGEQPITCALAGAEAEPIIIRSYPGEWAILDGDIDLSGGHDYILRSLEMRYSGWTVRQTDEGGSTPADLPHMMLPDLTAPRVSIEDCIIHDTAGGPGWWLGDADSHLKRCIIYNVGWESTADRGHGHLVYTQNDTGLKTIEDCIMFHSFSTGIKIYAQGGHARNYACRRNIVFNAGILSNQDDYQMNEWVQEEEGSGYVFEDEHTYHTDPTFDPVRLGLYDPVAGVTLRRNYWPEGLVLDGVADVDEDGFYGPRPTSGSHIWVNPVAEGRAHLALYNWDHADSLVVDVSAVLDPGASYRLINVQDYFVDRVTGTVGQDGTITVDMRAVAHTVAAPVAWPAPPTTFPKFGCFVLEAL